MEDALARQDNGGTQGGGECGGEERPGSVMAFNIGEYIGKGAWD